MKAIHAPKVIRILVVFTCSARMEFLLREDIIAPDITRAAFTKVRILDTVHSKVQLFAEALVVAHFTFLHRITT